MVGLRSRQSRHVNVKHNLIARCKLCKNFCTYNHELLLFNMSQRLHCSMIRTNLITVTVFPTHPQADKFSDVCFECNCYNLQTARCSYAASCLVIWKTVLVLSAAHVYQDQDETYMRQTDRQNGQRNAERFVQ